MKNLITLICLMIPYFISAQFNFGILTSKNLSTTPYAMMEIGNESGYLSHELSYLDAQSPVSFGLFGMYRKGDQFARVELMTHKSTSNYELFTYSRNRNDIKELQEIQKGVDVNVLGGLCFKNASIAVGPSIRYISDHSNDMNGLEFYNQSERKMQYGFIASIGVDIGKIHLDTRYERAFRYVNNNSTYYGRKLLMDLNPDMIKFVAGIRIL